MKFWTIVSLMGIVFTSAQTFPQIVKSLKSQKLRDLSMGLCLIVGGSSLCWFLYGFHLRDKAIMIANIINLVGAVFLLLLKLRYEMIRKGIQK